MSNEKIDSTKVNLCNMIFMQVIEEVMQGKGNVDWESVELASEDSPDIGDAMYTFADTDTSQKYRIFFKRSSLGERGFQYELFKQIKQMEWEKISAEFKKLI